ncbi:MAG: DnaA N-terminal domain-containing protein, partial [Angelakisella sp.]
MDSFREVFDLACKYCRAELSEVAYNLWIADIDPIGFDGSTVYLFIRTEFKKSIVEEKYLPLLGSAFESVLGFPVEIKFSCEETLAAPIPEPGEEPAPYVPGALPFGGEYEYTFDTF